jgi:probable 2-oxoglutarate dehydrogenase E1 component DHKTD1
MAKMDNVKELDHSRYGIQDGKYDLAGIIHVGKSKDPSEPRKEASLETILKHLKSSYCGRIGFEFAHIPVLHFNSSLQLNAVGLRNWLNHLRSLS